MSRAYTDLAFTPTVRAVQTRLGSRSAYAPLDHTDDRRDTLGEREREFIEARDSFYQATVSETGWPYVQHRGGPVGFLKVLDEKTLGFADFSGNRQYISVGNLLGNDRISLFLMDYANRRRLKLLGRVRLVSEAEDPALVARVEMPHYRARVERAFVIEVEGYDWNCPQHITPRFTEAEVEAELEAAVAPLQTQLQQLQDELAVLRARASQASQAEQARPAASGEERAAFGQGPLALQISAVRQLSERVRAYELRAVDGQPLPAIEAGAHLDVPVPLDDGAGQRRFTQRRYSISTDPRRRDVYEIAVQREDQGRGGSRAVHAHFQLGQRLNCALPGNDFALPAEGEVLLIAGGIGITPLLAMARQLRAQRRRFQLHFAVRSAADAPYLAEIERELAADEWRSYAADRGERLHVPALLAAAAPQTPIYACGPQRLLDALQQAATALGRAGQLHVERFAAGEAAAGTAEALIHVQRRGAAPGSAPLAVPVQAGQTLLDALEQAGLDAPSGCRNGECGQCALPLLAGRPEHRDQALSEAQRQQGLFCPCVSRGEGLLLQL